MNMTITEYRGTALSPNGAPLHLGARKQFVDVQGRADAGNLTLNLNTKFIRVATDSPITVNPNGEPELVVSETWFEVNGGETIAVAIVV